MLCFFNIKEIILELRNVEEEALKADYQMLLVLTSKKGKQINKFNYF